ncbi:MAG: hypothetical protein ACTSPD_13595 [Promethearchaeota archaeon]
MTNEQKISDKDYIFVVPHYINSLKYYDNLYDNLIDQNIEIVYLFKNNKEIENYLKNNKRKFEILNYHHSRKIEILIEPFLRYRLKKELINLFKKCKPKLVIQTNDSHPFNDVIVKVAKKFKILTLVLGWAVTGPEKLDFRNKKIKKDKILENSSIFRFIINKVFIIYLKLVHSLFHKFFGVYSNHKLSLAQGDSDIVGVINEFTKRLLIKQGIAPKKIRVVGHLHFDYALNFLKNHSAEKFREKYNLDGSQKAIVYFSQPFYTKDINILTFQEQLDYLKRLINNIENYYKQRKKKYHLFIKLHPVENIDAYKELHNNDNVTIISNADIHELILLAK